jgi:hypothetical protein
VVVILVALAATAQVARITSNPPISDLELAELEGAVGSNPADLTARARLLKYYGEYSRDEFRTTRLRHIMYLIDNRPADPLAASRWAYVYATGRAYADPGDHELARSAASKVWFALT